MFNQIKDHMIIKHDHLKLHNQLLLDNNNIVHFKNL